MKNPMWTLAGRVAFLVTGVATVAAVGQEAVVVEFPDPAFFLLNTTFLVDGDVGYVPSFDNDVLWSFSLLSGELLDPDGMALPGDPL